MFIELKHIIYESLNILILAEETLDKIDFFSFSTHKPYQLFQLQAYSIIAAICN